MSDFLITIIAIFLPPSICAALAQRRQALIWLPFLGVIGNACLVYLALFFSNEAGWGPIAALFALFWGYVLCFLFVLITKLVRAKSAL
jgi:hypothetical protein